MRFGDPRKFAIMRSLENPFDIEGYVKGCQEAGLPVGGTELEYAQKIGMYLYALQRYPEMSPFEAYMTVASGGKIARLEGIPDKVAGCGSCGGGQVR